MWNINKKYVDCPILQRDNVYSGTFMCDRGHRQCTSVFLHLVVEMDAQLT